MDTGPRSSLDRRRFLAEAGRRGWPLLTGLLGPSLPGAGEEDGAEPPPAPSAPPGADEDLPPAAAEEMEGLHRAFRRDNPDPDPWSADRG
jgi:hypothetical protein